MGSVDIPELSALVESPVRLGDSANAAVSWPVPHPAMRACVVVPVRNEEERLGCLIEALTAQSTPSGKPLTPASYEVLLLLNNCTDRSAEVARTLQEKYPALHLYFAEVSYSSDEAHVGKARQALFDSASLRFEFLQRAHGLILTTDADSRPASDWIAQNEAEIAKGVDAVGGRIVVEQSEIELLPPGVRRLFLLDIGYRRALEEMRSLYAPEAHNPFPRHHQNFGGSLAVTAAAYNRAGGMPLRPYREDVALYQAIVDSGGLFRHSYAARVYTSGRIVGRAAGGLADAIGWWNAQVEEAAPVLVESAWAAEVRLQKLGRWCFQSPKGAPPYLLATTPDQPALDQTSDIQTTLSGLRQRLEKLRPLTLSQRLGQRLLEPCPMTANTIVAV